MNQRTKLDYISAIAGLVYGGLFLLGSITMQVKGRAGDVGAAFMPRLVGGLIVLLSLIYLGTLLRNRKEENAEAESDSKSSYSINGVIKTCVLLLAYLVLIQVLGFVIASILYLFIQMNLLAPEINKRQLMISGVIAVILPIIVYQVFTRAFSLLLPSGMFF